ARRIGFGHSLESVEQVQWPVGRKFCKELCCAPFINAALGNLSAATPGRVERQAIEHVFCIQRYERPRISGPQPFPPLGTKPRTEHRLVIVGIFDIGIGWLAVYELKSKLAEEIPCAPERWPCDERGKPHMC